MTAEMGPGEPCFDAVREGDPDRFYAALFAPEPARGHLLVLYAFALEIAKTSEMVREPMLGQIRLQWWRDALAAIRAGGPVPAHPVAQALAPVIEAGILDAAALEGMVDARENDLESAPFDTWEPFLAYVDQTAGALLSQALLILRADGAADRQAYEDNTEALVRAGGRAWGMTGLLRAQAHHRSRHRFMLPRSVLNDHDVDVEDVLNGAQGPWAGLVRSVLAQEAHGAFLEARKVARGEARKAGGWRRTGPASAYLALVPPYLRALKGLPADRIDVPRPLGVPARVWRVAWTQMRKGL